MVVGEDGGGRGGGWRQRLTGLLLLVLWPMFRLVPELIGNGGQVKSSTELAKKCLVFRPYWKSLGFLPGSVA